MYFKIPFQTTYILLSLIAKVYDIYCIIFNSHLYFFFLVFLSRFIGASKLVKKQLLVFTCDEKAFKCLKHTQK